MQGNNSSTPNENLNKSSMQEEPFFERPFEEVEGGYYDGKGFYCTPEGSFWDENGVYFNRHGVDRHGGYYDDFCNYIPGPFGWNDEFGCYDDEIAPIEENVKETIKNNITEELIENYNRYQRYYKNLDNEFDEDDVAMDDLVEGSNNHEEEIFREYLEKYNNLQSSNNIEPLNSNDQNNFNNINQNFDGSNVNNNPKNFNY